MRKLYESSFQATLALPDGVTGIDAGLTLTKVVQARDGVFQAFAIETTNFDFPALIGAGHSVAVGLTGARAVSTLPGVNAVVSQEIDAASIGARALSDGGDGDFLLALLGTGTAFAAVHGDAATHLGGTALGGGSFAGIARCIDSSLTYGAMIAAAARGDRRRADLMVSDAYPEGIGRIGGDMTAAHLAKRNDGSIDDILAALLNLHGENVAQIAASRAVISKMPRILLTGGFAHENLALVQSITSMTALFGIPARAVAYPGFAGAIGAAIAASNVS